MQDFPVSYYSDEPIHSPIKVNLFTRIHEMQQLSDHLRGIAELPYLKKEDWLNENEELLHQSLETFAHQAPVQLDEPNMDNEMVKLLMEYTSALQELMSIVQTMFAPPKKLKKSKKTRPSVRETDNRS